MNTAFGGHGGARWTHFRLRSPGPGVLGLAYWLATVAGTIFLVVLVFRLVA